MSRIEFHTHVYGYDKRRNPGRVFYNDTKLGQLNLSRFLGDAVRFDSAVMNCIGKLVRDPGLSRTAIRLYVVLAGKINRKAGSCYPGVNSLADELGVSAQAIRKACRELEAAGFIHIDQNASVYRTNVFYLDFRELSSEKNAAENEAYVYRPETMGSGSLDTGIFGETAVSGLKPEDRELLEFAAKRSRVA
jgi:DNA-binding transcriptional regulator YhcF (GntR family)